MSSAAAIRVMLAKGLSLEEALEVVEAYEARPARGNRPMAITRTAALRVPCPYCLAGAGQACEGKRGARWAVHRDRLYQAGNIVAFPGPR
jgi:hypothetical protein